MFPTVTSTDWLKKIAKDKGVRICSEDSDCGRLCIIVQGIKPAVMQTECDILNKYQSSKTSNPHMSPKPVERRARSCLMRYDPSQYSRNMVNIPEIWSSYQKCGEHPRIMVNIPEKWSPYQIYGQNTRIMGNIPEIWPTYQKYGQKAKSVVIILEIWSTY